MHEVTVTRTIDAPTAAVWEVLDDFGGVATYNPGVLESGIIAGPDTGEGATRECVLDGSGRIEERIVDYEPNTSYTVEFIDMGDFPLKENVVTISVDEQVDTQTAVTMAARFTPKFGPLGWVMAKVMMESKFEETFGETLDGLASHVDSRVARGDPASEAASD
ncbi:SRPBCC family protein [Salinigranum marinum]|uniref:SRPBCC family protein n=1 Tax=Salinigranum marinum TaxID=1515595 RepID=UPI002989C290|nr:SRPBCC family protein [Salinigranum marinum]